MKKNDFDPTTADTEIGPLSSRFQHQQYQRAFEETRAELTAIPVDQLVLINLNVEAVVTMALGSEPRVRRFMGLLSRLPSYDVAQAKRLRLYAMSLWYCNGLYQQSLTPTTSLATLGGELIQLREKLLVAAEALSEWGFLDGSYQADLKMTVGYRNVADDVALVARRIRLQWHRCERRTAFTLAWLDEAAAKAEQMAFAWDTREERQIETGKAAELRMRAFTALMRAYDQVRRGIVFLRWHERDAEEIAPSLYATRAAPKRTPKGGASSPRA